MYINEIQLENISVNEIVPRTLIFDEIPIQASNTISICKRYTYGGTTGTDISTLISVTSNTNQAVLTDIWLGSETAAAGTYRIQIVMYDATGTAQKQEVNLKQKVVANT